MDRDAVASFLRPRRHRSYRQEMDANLDGSQEGCYNSHKAKSPIRYRSTCPRGRLFGDDWTKSIYTAGWERKADSVYTTVRHGLDERVLLGGFADTATSAC